jgi:hypothetical protein
VIPPNDAKGGCGEQFSVPIHKRDLLLHALLLPTSDKAIRTNKVSVHKNRMCAVNSQRMWSRPVRLADRDVDQTWNVVNACT